ncbi:helix-turn-helix transcriptional regulator [Paenibacillus sacheonensis]|uniref:Helix-turn-helix domain-containing protein n=1 Tax=Paenibacillus sacheonensis TaxID=742054 RepID=A0A7X4YSK1_9BACL|nr:helix-turn-helix domain-containing protein [Paenibacillus sacheonensis]MBM7568215.1 AraC-like DNA-binding protein [Paenibacillus sacheonensis]NBC71787.1 helix-turn-helix domain-containing protein [Paenibacillus sacheonensis]
MRENAAAYAIPLRLLQRLMLHPIRIGGLSVILLDALSAEHDADWAHPPHRHPWYEFNYVSRGGLFTTSAGEEFRIEAGQSYLIPPGAVHAHRHGRGESDDGFCLRWQIMLEDGRPADGMSEEAEFIRCFSQVRPYALKAESAAPLLALRTDMSLLTLETAFAGWMTGLFEDWRARAAEHPVQAQDHADVIVRQTLLFLQAYYATELRVQEIANALHVSYRTLARLFRQQTGLTVVEKLNDIRIRQAKKLLIETDLPMKQIAFAVGLKNEFYFSNLFSRVAMTTPSDFRGLHKVPQV